MTYSLEYLRRETHLVLPRYSPFTLSRNIYDLLFQYVLTPERETLLKNFIQKLETYTKTKPDAPFSIALQDLEFLGEGWQELKLLNWFEVPVTVFALHMQEGATAEDLEQAQDELRNLMLLNPSEDGKEIIVFPRDFVF